MLKAAYLALGTICAAMTAMAAQSFRMSPPKISSGTWVMIEFWPEVQDITYSAYFLEPLEKDNKHLCEMTKRIFDRDARARSKKIRKKFTSYRRCFALDQAWQQGILPKK